MISNRNPPNDVVREHQMSDRTHVQLNENMTHSIGISNSNHTPLQKSERPSYTNRISDVSTMSIYTEIVTDRPLDGIGTFDVLDMSISTKIVTNGIIFAILTPDQTQIQEQNQTLGRTTRTSNPIRNDNFYYLDDDEYNAANFSTKHPLYKQIFYHRMNKKQKNLIKQITLDNEPKNFNNEAFKDPNWIQAMKLEIDALKTNNT